MTGMDGVDPPGAVVGGTDGSVPGEVASGVGLHRYVVRIETVRLDHDHEVSTATRAMTRKGWAVEERATRPGDGGATVTLLTFTQPPRRGRAPNAPVPPDIRKDGRGRPRRFRRRDGPRR